MPVLILYLSLSCFLPEGGVVTDNPRKDVPSFIPVDGVISWWKSELTVRAKVVPNCNVHYEPSEDPSIGYILGREPGHGNFHEVKHGVFLFSTLFHLSRVNTV